MTKQFQNRRGPDHVPYSELKSINKIRGLLKHCQARKPQIYYSHLSSIPESLYKVEGFIKLIMAWEHAKYELNYVFMKNTTCRDCWEAPWNEMPWRHANTTRMDKLLAELREDMENYRIWEDMFLATYAIEGFCVRWAEAEDQYLRETQRGTACSGLIGPNNPDGRLKLDLRSDCGRN